MQQLRNDLRLGRTALLGSFSNTWPVVSNMELTVVYTESGKVLMPENRVTELAEGQSCEAMRGYGYMLAVFQTTAEGEVCIGWIDVGDLGFKTAADWMAARS